ncbi:MAG TPA: enoyl-CoA hydratase/isomerase family protein [Thermoanaerobaculia bacterium]|nr:enoyl-CoA hydratase/isomerase family protein [Thermoanaerobaculia bacterium]
MTAENGYTTLRVETAGPVASVTLNRPDVRNAFDEAMIAELTRVFGSFEAGGDRRAVVLSGEGKTFCAGADVNWMRRAASFSPEENREDARRMARMLRTIDTSPLPVIGKIRGAAIGGGVGLAAVCDIAIAAAGTVFSLAEVKLGILPAAISPYVLRAIGARSARDCFLTGERFDAAEARRIGLVHAVVDEADLDAAVGRKVDALLSSGPEAVAAAKSLIDRVSGLEIDEAFPVTADAIAERRASAEGQEGLSAFLEKRRPSWFRSR